MLSQQAWVLVAMSPSTRLPFLSAGIWPERKIWPFALTAWDCLLFSMCYENGLLVALSSISVLGVCFGCLCGVAAAGCWEKEEWETYVGTHG